MYRMQMKEFLFYRTFPRIFLELMRKYFRVEVEGLENVPKKGAAIVVPNHSGFSGLDAMILSHILIHDRKRVPRVLTHGFWFFIQWTTQVAEKLGFFKATYENGIYGLNRNDLIVLFPEGEAGNFKSSQKMYQLQEFKRGFVRMALQTGAPIIPTLIIGAEETSINLSQYKLTKFLKGSLIPIPLNIIPLPIKWKIRFLPPIELPYKSEAVKDLQLARDLASEIQEQMQAELNREIKKRV